MALIKCPECGKEVSDKAEKCINCGYPLRNTPYLCEEIDGKEYDVSFLLDKSLDVARKVVRVKNITKCSVPTAFEVVSKYCSEDLEELRRKNREEANKKKCPYCRHTEFTPVRKKWSLLAGFATNKTELICNNCGRKVE